MNSEVGQALQEAGIQTVLRKQSVKQQVSLTGSNDKRRNQPGERNI
jgi:hypothetical protein